MFYGANVHLFLESAKRAMIFSRHKTKKEWDTCNLSTCSTPYL